MEIKEYIKYLNNLNACSDAVEWSKQFKTSQEAWDKCDHGDWMLWLLGKQCGKPESKSRKKLVLAACKCARLSLKYVPKGEKRPLKAIQTAEKWAKGVVGISLSDVQASAASAERAAEAARWAWADAAWAAARVESVANVTWSAQTKTLKKCANIVRKMYPKIEV